MTVFYHADWMDVVIEVGNFTEVPENISRPGVYRHLSDYLNFYLREAI